MNNIVMSGLIVGVLLIIFYVPYLLAKGLTQICYDKKLTGGQQVKCAIPIYNVFYADLTYYGKLSLPSWAFIAVVVVIIGRVLQWLFLYDASEILTQVMVVAVWAVLAFWWIANAINSFMIMKDSTVVPVGKAIIFSIIFPLGYFYIGSYLVNVMLHELNSQEDSSWSIDDEGF